MLKVLQPLTAQLAAFFKARPQVVIGNGLYAGAVAQARLPVFYIDYGVRDEIGARFELLCLHVVMLVTALREDKAEIATETGQAVFDAFLQSLDDLLREQGVGDVSVPKKMKGIITNVYTRLKAWDDMWKDGADTAQQAQYLKDTVYAVYEDDAPIDNIEARVAALMDYVTVARAALKPADLIEGRAAWPVPAYSES